MNANAIKRIDKAIKKIWRNEIKADYLSYYLLKEDSLKNAFYHHLRNELGDHFLERNHLRIYTEFSEGVLKTMGLRPDIAIVELADTVEGYIADCLKSVCVLIELKYLSDPSGAEAIYRDFEKIKRYKKSLGAECQYYAGVIHEVFWETRAWLDKRTTNCWAKGSVTELTASLDQDNNMIFEVHSYNDLNEAKHAGCGK